MPRRYRDQNGGALPEVIRLGDRDIPNLRRDGLGPLGAPHAYANRPGRR